MSPSSSLRWPRSHGLPSASGEPRGGNGSPVSAQGAGKGAQPHTRGSLPCSGVGCGSGEVLTMPWPSREHLEAEQLLDRRYQLQEVPGGRMALPVLEDKLSLLSLPQEMPCGLVRIQVGTAPEPCYSMERSHPHVPHSSRRIPSPPGHSAGGRLPRGCRMSCGGCWARAGRRSWSEMCPAPGSGTGTWCC